MRHVAGREPLMQQLLLREMTTGNEVSCGYGYEEEVGKDGYSVTGYEEI